MSTTPVGRKERTYRVLIVDDYAVERAGFAAIILSAGSLEVCGQSDTPEDALEKARQLLPDLVTVDLHQGFAVQRKLVRDLRQISDAIKILVIGEKDGEHIEEGWEAEGATEYLEKHTPVDQIIRTIYSVLEVERPGANTEFRPTPAQMALPLHRLSPRELKVFDMLGSGMTTAEVADFLHVSVKTIESHRESIKDKLDIENFNRFMHHAVQWYLMRGQKHEGDGANGGE